MTIEISSDQPRSIKAISIAAGAAAWIKCHTKSGQKVYGIPSQRVAGQYHLTTSAECSCFDFQRRREPCKHVLAVRLHCELVKAQQPKPKTKAERPVLDMIREPDGSIRWERSHSHPQPIADASTYDRCHAGEAF